MSEEDKAPKKAARKRVVKKGVRGTRAPRKKAIEKKEEISVEADDVSNEEFFNEDNETTYALETGEPMEPVREIEFVEEESLQPEEESPKEETGKGDRRRARPQKEKPNERSNERPKEDSEEENSEDEGEDRRDGRNRRGRNRRGGNSREREESGSKRAAVDKDEAAAKAWEIYQGELEEEGVSLVDPRRAREVARRCLELATVFCEERDRYLDR